MINGMADSRSSSHPLVITLDGEWDLARAEELEKTLEPAYDQPLVILDMTNTTYADSTCLGRLIKMRSHRREKEFEPAFIVLPSPQLRKLFDLVGFDKIWPLFDTLEEARAEMERVRAGQT